ncbi:MAG: cell division topological specificity factor MinE [Beggiatoa sp. IS2]|nr:MAG: cell division topological specificity factor MinE [Beggiatoa sp. IS2]
MGFFSYFRASQQKNTALLAKERLQIIVAHERHQRDGSHLDYLPSLQKELLEVVRKYFVIKDEHIKINLEKEGDCEILEVNIALNEAENRYTK